MSDLDRVRYLINAVMSARGLTQEAAFGPQVRTAQRFLKGENVRTSSLSALQRALGISGLTFYFVEHGQWAQALDQDNADDVRAAIRGLMPERRRVVPLAERRSDSRLRAFGNT